ncbi:dTDP-3-amino-3,6-dideoxy-alpha-D-galactopyranose transaminase [compost metagenome]
MVSVMESHVFHLYVVRVNSRNEFMEYLRNKSIETLIHYPNPPHRQNCYSRMHGLSMPITERIHEEVVSLPMSPAFLEGDLEKIVSAINEFK